MNSNIKELGVSFIRTSLVPPLAAIILQWLLAHKINFLNESVVFTGVTFVISGIWYVTFRSIEVISEKPAVKKWAGIFLGYPRSEIPRV